MCEPKCTGTKAASDPFFVLTEWQNWICCLFSFYCHNPQSYEQSACRGCVYSKSLYLQLAILSRMFFFLLLIIFSMFFVINTIYYTLSLLVVTCIRVSTLVVLTILHPLTGIMLLLVYLGAIMILIGYICAVSPNFITSPVSLRQLISILTSVLASIFLFSVSLPVARSSAETPIALFFSSHGLFLFALIVRILFVCLLIVTSQYFSPKGPFRSV